MALLGRPPIHKTLEEQEDAQKGYRKKYWRRNSKHYNSRRREEYARKKEQAGASVRAYNRKPKATKDKKFAQRIEREVESPQARVKRTTELTLSRARSIRNDMRALLDGTPGDYFNQLCENYIECDDTTRAEENIDRLSSKFNTLLKAINQFEDPILNAVGSWAPQMREYQALRDEVRKAANMVDEIQEAALTGGKAEVLCRATEGAFTFQNSL
ncbi:hypothetical protein BKA70DRAFT_1442299 [Coprinopsis sp. MPI-PUGE-AT-0042]|nr:hypothetical protein BKA70DRAFT_1442299 [Coprinopsis sp. MPI-PUGE-AT-0042]